jgi:hypothetical protein
MKLVSMEHGQVLMSLIAEEVRPPSGYYLPDLLKAIAERYAFVTLPTIQDALREGAKFNQGRFIDQDRTIEIKMLGVFSDGILVTTFKTDDAVIVLEDMMSLAEHFGFRRPLTLRPRQFGSSVIVDFDSSLDNALQAIQSVKTAFAAALQAHYGWSLEIETSRLVVACDPTNLPPQRTAELIIERRAGVPFSQNRYFSAAPLSTEAHLELLERFERLLI